MGTSPDTTDQNRSAAYLLLQQVHDGLVLLEDRARPVNDADQALITTAAGGAQDALARLEVLTLDPAEWHGLDLLSYRHDSLFGVEARLRDDAAPPLRVARGPVDTSTEVGARVEAARLARDAAGALHRAADLLERHDRYEAATLREAGTAIEQDHGTAYDDDGVELDDATNWTGEFAFWFVLGLREALIAGDTREFMPVLEQLRGYASRLPETDPVRACVETLAASFAADDPGSTMPIYDEQALRAELAP